MSKGKTIILSEPRHMEALREALAGWRNSAEQGKPLAVTVAETKRSLEQNALMWVILAQWAKQKEWQVNGRSCHLVPDDWKDILTAAFLHEAGRIAPGLEGGMVLLGCRTRDFGIKEMAEFLDWLQAASVQHKVILAPMVEDIEPTGRVA